MTSIHRVITYSGLNYYQVLELPVDVFMLMVKDSMIADLMKTNEGCEYLKKCERMQETEIDISAFRKMKAGNRKEGVMHGNS